MRGLLPDVGTKWVAVVNENTENIGGFSLLEITNLYSGLLPDGDYAPIETSGQVAFNDLKTIYQAHINDAITQNIVDKLESKFGVSIVKELLIN